MVGIRKYWMPISVELITESELVEGSSVNRAHFRITTVLFSSSPSNCKQYLLFFKKIPNQRGRLKFQLI